MIVVLPVDIHGKTVRTNGIKLVRNRHGDAIDQNTQARPRTNLLSTSIGTYNDGTREIELQDLLLVERAKRSNPTDRKFVDRRHGIVLEKVSSKLDLLMAFCSVLSYSSQGSLSFVGSRGLVSMIDGCC